MAGLNSMNHMRLQLVTFLATIILILFMPFFVTDLKSAESTKDSKVAQKGEVKANIYNLYNAILGSVDTEGNVTNRYGSPLGSVDSSGIIYNVSKIVIGQVTPEGNVLNQSGTVLGSVGSDGAIYNVSGRKVGEARDVEDIILIGGAARLLFLK
jgi:uncharacterized membrane protein YeiB